MEEYKVTAITESVDKLKKPVQIVSAYGNLPVNIPMMKMADKSFYVKKDKVFQFK